jgi:hypothetical protein
MNKLDVNLKNEPKLQKLKTGIRQWVKKNVAIKPSPKYPALLPITPRRQQARPAQTQQSQEDIRRFFIPQNQLQPQPIVEAPPPPTDRPPPTAANDIRRYFQPEPSNTNR